MVPARVDKTVPGIVGVVHMNRNSVAELLGGAAEIGDSAPQIKPKEAPRMREDRVPASPPAPRHQVYYWGTQPMPHAGHHGGLLNGMELGA